MIVNLFWQPANDKRAIEATAPGELYTFLTKAFGPIPMRLDETAIPTLRGAELTALKDAPAYRALIEAITVNKVVEILAESRQDPPVPRTLKTPQIRTISPRRS